MSDRVSLGKLHDAVICRNVCFFSLSCADESLVALPLFLYDCCTVAALSPINPGAMECAGSSRFSNRLSRKETSISFEPLKYKSILIYSYLLSVFRCDTDSFLSDCLCCTVTTSSLSLSASVHRLSLPPLLLSSLKYFPRGEVGLKLHPDRSHCLLPSRRYLSSMTGSCIPSMPYHT